MTASLELLLGLLDEERTPAVSKEDLEGENGLALRVCQEIGFLSKETAVNPVLSCPYCTDGVPYRLGKRLICNHCRSTVEDQELLLWQIDREGFLRWLAAELHLRGNVRRVNSCLWQLGTWAGEGEILECFFRTRGTLSDPAKNRLSAYRNVLVLYGLSPPTNDSLVPSRFLSLLELLRMDDTLHVADLAPLLRPRGNVRFDMHSGTLWAGEAWMGEVPFGSKEFFFLRCLAERLDRFVAYADLKHEVLRQSGSIDETEEATFCQGLKSRIKKKWIPEIDRLIVTTNKADGYRLRSYAEL